MLKESYERVKNLLNDNHENLQNIAKELIRKETMTGIN
jgi:ATP-dependent Zn protease